MFLINSYNFAFNPFIIEVDTTKAGSANDTFILPLDGTSTYNFDVDWGDGNIETVTTNTNKTHTYSSPGVYEIKISGTFPHMYFNGVGDKLKLTEIKSWGTIAWASMENAFYGCTNMDSTAVDYPDFRNVTTMASMFRGCASFNGDVSNWDTSNVIYMELMFTGCTVFNQSVSNFDTSNVINMGLMFSGCAAFNQSVSNWDTSSVEWMRSMFYGCTVFNQSVSNFDTSSVINMGLMFAGCDAFNQSVSNWDTSNVTKMDWMFYGADLFNQDISHFDIENVTDAESMLTDSAFDTTNYDLLLVAWEAQTENPNVVFSAGNAKYSSGAPATARAALVANGWVITDGGPA